MNNTTAALKSSPKLACALSFAILSAPAMAAITYVDAAEGASGNTFATGGSSEVTTWIDGTANTGTNDTQWVKRPFANSSTIFQGMSNGSAAGIPELTTQISGLANGNYTLWAFYWDQVTNDTQNWTLAAGLTSGSLTTYSSPGEPDVGAVTTGVSNAADLSFTNAPDITDSPRELFGINLGQVSVTDGTANVYVDMLIDGNSGTSRTWYDGVGFEAAPVPEPTSLALFGLAGAGLILRRRRS